MVWKWVGARVCACVLVSLWHPHPPPRPASPARRAPPPLRPRLRPVCVRGRNWQRPTPNNAPTNALEPRTRQAVSPSDRRHGMAHPLISPGVAPVVAPLCPAKCQPQASHVPDSFSQITQMRKRCTVRRRRIVRFCRCRMRFCICSISGIV